MDRGEDWAWEEVEMVLKIDAKSWVPLEPQHRLLGSVPAQELALIQQLRSTEHYINVPSPREDSSSFSGPK